MQAGAAASGAAPVNLPLPAGVSAADVTGVQVVFTNAAGELLPTDAVGGSVELAVALRDTYRSTGQPLAPSDNIDVRNCATPVAVEVLDDAAQPAVTGSEACAQIRIHPDVLVLDTTKRFFPDTNGSFSQDANEHAVIGERSPVTGDVTVVNRSPFPIEQIVVTEPTAPHELDKVDIESVRVTLPSGATSATVVITYADGSTDTRTLTATATLTGLHQAGNQITSVVVTFTGTDADGEPTIAPNASAVVAVHGRLTDAVDTSDIPTQANVQAGVENCAGITGDAGRGDGTGTYSGVACRTLPVEARDSHANGTKTSSQTSFPPDQPVTFTLEMRNGGNLPLINPTIVDPPVDGADVPQAPNVFEHLEILDASVTTYTGAPTVALEVYVPGDGWVALSAARSAGDLPDAVGIRARAIGEVGPGRTIRLTVVVQRRAGVPDSIAINNCFTVAADGADYQQSSPWCAPGLFTGPADAGATLAKSIAPGQLPRHVPGLPVQTADVTLRIRNAGNMSARHLRIMDADVDFFDAVDFRSISIDEAHPATNMETYRSDNVLNYLNWSSATYDELLADLRAAATPDEQKAALARIEELWAEEAPALVYNNIVEMIVWSDAVDNLTFNVNTVVFFDQATKA